MQKTSMILPYEFEIVFQSLPMDEAGKLILAIYAYEQRNIIPDFSENPALMFAWNTHIKPKIDENIEKYKATCEARRTAGSKGGRPSQENQNNQEKAKKANGFSENQNNQKVSEKAKEPDYDGDGDGDGDGESNINNTNVLFVPQECDEPSQNHKNDYTEIIEAWNLLPVTNIKAIKGTRLSMLKARLKDYTIDEVLSAISGIREQPFLLGQNNKGWQITFDWFVKPNNFIKVYEGNYKETQSKTHTWNDAQAGYEGAMKNLEVLIDE